MTLPAFPPLQGHSQNGAGAAVARGPLDPRLVLAATCGALMLAGAATGHALFVGAGSAALCMACRNAEQAAVASRGDRMSALASRLLQSCGPYTVDGGRAVDVPAEATVEEVASEKVASGEADGTSPVEHTLGPTAEGASAVQSPAAPAELVDTLIAQGRYALLLRPEPAQQLTRAEHQRVLQKLDEEMAIVPAGAVMVGMAAERATLGHADHTPADRGDESIRRVEACYLARWAVTNEAFCRFVAAGGYDRLDLWPEAALPALFDFVDATGRPGPRYWRHGRPADGDARRPVVGVSWYEAAAFARWEGLRLPTDAEWTKACAWPIESAPGRIAQRRYPWGEAFDARRANLWCAGLGGPAAVDDFPEGATVGGHCQMVGNTWEWTADTLSDATPAALHFPAALRCVRGGAYNTYFENQATCHYQSGEHPLARRGNIGFRLAIDMAGLASPGGAEATA
ncbi:MAG: SUMF1/EgtB/PvdO family nonheme iron enzyme [Planctomycetota bacterium]